MIKKLIAVLLVTILLVGGCGPTLHQIHMQELKYDTEQFEARVERWKKDWAENEQKIKSNLTQLESILSQQTSLLEDIGNDDQIDPAGFQLYKDFTVFIQPSEDQIKIYEFIEKMRAVLPADKMQRITDLHLELRENLIEHDTLQEKRQSLKLRLDEFARENEEFKRKIRDFEQQEFQQRLLLRQQLNSY